MADNIDIIVILGGYLMMLTTFVSLYMNMRSMGSRYTLATAVMVNGFFSFMLALLTVHALGVDVYPVVLAYVFFLYPVKTIKLNFLLILVRLFHFWLLPLDLNVILNSLKEYLNSARKHL